MKKSLFITSALMTLVLAGALSTGTYAWYQTTVSATVSNSMTITAQVSSNEDISYGDANEAVNITYGTINGGSETDAFVPVAYGAMVDEQDTAPVTNKDAVDGTWFTCVEAKGDNDSLTYIVDHATKGRSYAMVNCKIPAVDVNLASHYQTIISVSGTGSYTSYSYALCNSAGKLQSNGSQISKDLVVSTPQFTDMEQHIYFMVWLDGSNVSNSNQVTNATTLVINMKTNAHNA